MKSIIKEIIIIVLLCMAIILILATIFYNYIPFNKIIPSKVEAYVTPNSIKNEINEEIVEYPKENITFEITDSDLTLYKQSKSYTPGKSNPFENYVEGNGSTSAATNKTTGESTTSTENQTKTNVTAKNSAEIIDDTKLK